MVLVVEVADQFPFLGVNTDDRLLPVFEPLSLLGNDPELPVTVWMVRLGNGFAVAAQRIVRSFQYFADAVRAAAYPI
jgi:hypothetical protein